MNLPSLKRTELRATVDERRKIELSERERQLVNLAAEGHTDASIAHRLGISEATVSTYWGRVRTKIGPYSRPELIAKIIHAELDEVVAELQRENHELVSELQRASGREWGDETANYYRKLVMQAPEAIIIVDDHGIIETANEEFEALFGYGPDQLHGLHHNVVIPERYRLIHGTHVEEYAAHPERRRMAEHSLTLGLKRSGQEFSITAALSPVQTASGLRVMCIVRAAESVGVTR